MREEIEIVTRLMAGLKIYSTIFKEICATQVID